MRKLRPTAEQLLEQLRAEGVVMVAGALDRSSVAELIDQGLIVFDGIVNPPFFCGSVSWKAA